MDTDLVAAAQQAQDLLTDLSSQRASVDERLEALNRAQEELEGNAAIARQALERLGLSEEAVSDRLAPFLGGSPSPDTERPGDGREGQSAPPLEQVAGLLEELGEQVGLVLVGNSDVAVAEDLERRLEQIRDVIARLDELREGLGEIRAITVATYRNGSTESDWSDRQVASHVGLSPTSVANILAEHRSATVEPQLDGESSDGFPPPLGPDEVDALRGALLQFTATAVSSMPSGPQRKQLELQEDKLRSDFRKVIELSGAGDPDWIDDEGALAARLGEIRSVETALQILVEVAASVPWAPVEFKLDKTVRASLGETRDKYVKWLAAVMPGVDEEDARYVSRELHTRFYSRSNGLDVVGSLAGSAAVAASGAMILGGPVTSAAVGVAASISLSKERRYQAQLAALGGGSLAAGGIGLAAGTALIGSVAQTSGDASAEAGPRLRPRLTKSIAKAESIKLTCLVRALRQHERRDMTAPVVAHRYELKMDEVAQALEDRSAVGNGTNEDKRRKRLISNALKEIRRP